MHFGDVFIRTLNVKLLNTTHYSKGSLGWLKRLTGKLKIPTLYNLVSVWCKMLQFRVKLIQRGQGDLVIVFIKADNTKVTSKRWHIKDKTIRFMVIEKKITVAFHHQQPCYIACKSLLLCIQQPDNVNMVFKRNLNQWHMYCLK